MTEEEALAGAYRQGEAIATLLDELASAHDTTAIASRLARWSDRPRQVLAALVDHPTPDASARAARQLDMLDILLALSVEDCAASCRMLADRLAVAEEFDDDGDAGASRVAWLAHRLDRAVN